MSEILKGPEQFKQPEEIHLDQEFFPYPHAQFSRKKIAGYPGGGKFHYSKEYKLFLQNKCISVNFISMQIADDELAIKPFNQGYTVDGNDFDLTNRKNKLIAATQTETNNNSESLLTFEFTMPRENLVESGMVKNKYGKAKLTKDGEILSLLRLGISANGKYESRITYLDDLLALDIRNFYPVDAGPLANDHPVTGLKTITNGVFDVSAGPGHELLLPNNKMLLDQIGARFYLDRPLMQKQKFQEK